MRIKWFSLVRITGLIFVLTYHFYENLFTGGFIGVDIFFTFSGFLITALMVDEFGKKGSFNLNAFLHRRFYRIFPPLVLMVLIALPFTSLLSSDFITGLGKQVAAALGFTTNFFEIATGGSYESQFIPHLFVHTWSLAVEMHYYIVWGVLALLASILAVKMETRPERQLPRFRSLLLFISTVYFFGSLLTMIVGSDGLKDFSPVYFSSVTHSFPFFLGSNLALLTGIKQTTRNFNKTIARFTANKAKLLLAGSFLLLLALAFTLKFDSRTTYLYGFVATSFLCCVMIFAARILHEKTTGTEPKIISFLADTSYGVYLFHWPLYIVFSHLFTSGRAALLTTALSLVFASFSYYFIEPLVVGKKMKLQGTAKKLVVIPLTLIALLLTANTVYSAVNAPKISNLEKNLWIGNIYQDDSRLQQTHDVVVAAAAAEKKAAEAKAAAAAAKTAEAKAAARLAALPAIPKGTTIIGDSVTLGTSKYLSEHVPDSSVNAEGNRQIDKGYAVLFDLQNKGLLRENVVFAIGTNGLEQYKEFTDSLIHRLNPGHRLIFVTPHDGRGNPTYFSYKVGVYEQTLPAKFPYITIADWNAAATAHPAIFGSGDGTHFAGNGDGDILFAKTINDALAVAAKKPAKTQAEAEQSFEAIFGYPEIAH